MHHIHVYAAHDSRGVMFRRDWSQEELDEDLHINLLEVRAAKEAEECSRKPVLVATTRGMDFLYTQD